MEKAEKISNSLTRNVVQKNANNENNILCLFIVFYTVFLMANFYDIIASSTLSLFELINA